MNFKKPKTYGFTPLEIIGTRKKHQENKSLTGFTLIELSLAIFILTIGIVGIVSMFPLGIRIGKTSEISTIAAQLSQAKIEEIVSKSYTDIPTGIIEPKTELPSPFNGYFRETEVNYYDPVNTITTDTDLGIKKIRVTVSWELNLGVSNKSIDIFTLITNR